MNKLYQSVLIHLSTIAPLFARVILDKAIKKIGKSPDDVSAVDLINVLNNDINRQLSKDANSSQALLMSHCAHLQTNQANEIIYINAFMKKILENLKKTHQHNGLTDFQILHQAKLVKTIQECPHFMVQAMAAPFDRNIRFEVYYTPVFTKGGAIIGVQSLIKDITLSQALENEAILNHQQLENEIEQKKIMQQELVHASKLVALGEMSGGIAHEINNPLTIISLNLSSLKKSLESEKLQNPKIMKRVLEIEKSVERTERIVASMKRISHGGTIENAAIYKFKEIVEDVLNVLKEKCSTLNIKIDYTISIEQLAWQIRANYSEISQVIINLCNNSIDAIENSPEDKWIRFEFYDNQDYYCLAITDSGKGIDDKTMTKIFQPFFTTKDVGKGTGLGLSISRTIMQNHGGNLIYVKESPNTRFVLTLPKPSAV
jgi:C4-dicarboxylate-specific signal transduction histidine kinase